MNTVVQMLIAGVVLTGLTTPAAAQKQQSETAPKQSAKDEPRARNSPAAITKDQAEEILQELKGIHRLLERQQAAAVPAQAAPTSDKVQMDVATGWYSLGHDDAPVTVVEFSDYQCPFCRKFQAETFAALKTNYIDTGRVRFVSRDLPLDFHPNAQGSAMAARCAGEQNKFWEMRDMMLASNADLTITALVTYAGRINLEMTAFSACLNGSKYNAAIQRDIADAGTLGIRGTPSFVVGKTARDQIKGTRIAGAVSYSVLETAIKNQLNSLG